MFKTTIISPNKNHTIGTYRKCIYTTRLENAQIVATFTFKTTLFRRWCFAIY